MASVVLVWCWTSRSSHSLAIVPSGDGCVQVYPRRSQGCGSRGRCKGIHETSYADIANTRIPTDLPGLDDGGIQFHVSRFARFVSDVPSTNTRFQHGQSHGHNGSLEFRRYSRRCGHRTYVYLFRSTIEYYLCEFDGCGDYPG